MEEEDLRKLLEGGEPTPEEIKKREPLMKVYYPMAFLHRKYIEEMDRETGLGHLVTTVASLIIFCTKDIDEAIKVHNKVKKIFEISDGKINKN